MEAYQFLVILFGALISLGQALILFILNDIKKDSRQHRAEFIRHISDHSIHSFHSQKLSHT